MLSKYIFFLSENDLMFVFLVSLQLSDDWQIDYESYTWRKLDVDSEECKTMVKEYFAWEGEFKHVGKPFNQGKIFKWEQPAPSIYHQNQWTWKLFANPM